MQTTEGDKVVIIAVDDEKIALEGVLSVAQKVLKGEQILGFRLAEEAYEYVKLHGCDIAFLDIEMRDENGLDLAKQILELNPKANVIFTTGYGEYAGNAFEMHASGYIMKPVTEEKVRNELKALRYPIDQKEKKLTVKAFGNFEVFAGGAPLRFQYTKSRELFAYLVDRNGALSTVQEIITILWEDDDDQDHTSYLKNIRSDLVQTLTEAGCEDVLVRQRGRIGIIPDKLDCDYYKYLSDRDTYGGLYQGEYMAQYSWGEYTHGQFE